MGDGSSWTRMDTTGVDLSSATLLKLDYRVTQYATDDISQANMFAVFINDSFDEEAPEGYGFSVTFSATSDWTTKYISIPATCRVANATVSIGTFCVYGL
jgi:hypothetical protein